MSQMDVFLLSVKVRALEGSSIDMDGCEFYYVEIFVPVDSTLGFEQKIAVAIDSSKEVLSSDNLQLEEISKLLLFKEAEWKGEGEFNDELREEARKSLATGKVCKGAFRSEEIEEECEYSISLDDLA
ncbi:hypothetical protein [Hahella ganghwensis]|uniref:hypothetical protein n=1 Tax=Hahella ganghwensis TaxID=286420 RepID=UPI0003807312|nr:hypothetical protein [Hahella ganghwensis]